MALIRIRRPTYLIRQVRARLRSPDIAPEIAEDVLSRYGLKLLGRPRNISVGRRSRNVVLSTPDGKMVLKQYRRNMPSTRIAYGHSIMQHLGSVGFPAPRLMQTHGGESIVHRSGFHYALFEYIRGTKYGSCVLMSADYRKITSIAGNTLASFHRQLEDFTPKGQHPLGFRSFEEPMPCYATRHNQTINDLKERSARLRDPDALWYAKQLVNASNELLDELSGLHETLKSASLPLRIIHGDFGLHNLLYHDLGAATLTDFELARIEWRLSDFVVLMPRFRADGLKSLVAAYQRQCRWNEAEREMLPLVWEFRNLCSVIQAWKSFFDLDHAQHKLRSACQHLEQINWGRKNRKALRELFNGSTV